MKTSAPLKSPSQQALLLLSAGLLGLPGLTTGATTAKEPVYENYIDLALGYNLQSGDRPAFQKNKLLNKSGFGGIEGLYYTSEMKNGAIFTLKGRALAGNGDYLLDLRVAKDDFGYINIGYKQFRVWYDGRSTYFPPTQTQISLYDEDMHIDRGNLWLELGYVPEDKINFVFRYDMFTRKGQKDSTSWGDTNLTAGQGTKGLLPAFWKIDERRHQVSATLSRQEEKSNWQLATRYDKGEYDNSRNARRRANEPSVDRVVTTKDGRDYDLFMVRGSYENQVTEQLKITTGVLHTKIDTTLSGSRIYGPDYDPVYDAAFVRRQQRDEGYFDLHGETETRQTVATISALYLPNAKWSITPSLRFERLDWNNMAEFEETNFGAGPALAPLNDEVEALSDKAWKNNTQSLEARYKGIPNWTFNLKGELTQSTGDLSEQRIVEPGTPAESLSIDRDTEFDRKSQKYTFTTNWYPKPGMTIALQYYYKARQNEYNAVRDNTPAGSADRYPAYVENQDFTTNDINARVSMRLTSSLRAITRYDYQKSTIDSQDIGLPNGESARMTSHIVSETISWNPLNRWYVQGGVNYVWDTLMTPAVTLTGNAAGLVKNSDANYVNFNLGSGYALDDQTDIYVDYILYKAQGNYVDNSTRSVAYGTEGKSQDIALTWHRRLDRHTSLTFKYTYSKYDDAVAPTYASYEAHLLYGKLQYRF